MKIMEINTTIYYEEFKNLWKYCATKGLIIPQLLTEYTVPVTYKYKPKEMETILKQISKKTRVSSKEKYIKRRKEEKEIISKHSLNSEGDYEKLQSELNDYHIKELKAFIKNNPKFKKIIKES